MLLEVLRQTESGVHVVHSRIHVKFWSAVLPAVDTVRPGRCPRCRVAARPIGGPLGLVGHGIRERQLRGPARIGAQPELVVITIRRYLCRHCGAVCTVVPRGVVRRRHFSAGAIGWTLFLLGHEHLSSRAVRDRVGGQGSSEAGVWITAGRWLKAVEEQRLFRMGAALAGSTSQRAERIAMVLISFAPPALAMASLAEQAFAGAEVLARAA